jgi:hypothetical protein
MKKRNESQLPIIDIGSLWSDAPDGKLADIGEQVYEACRSMGRLICCQNQYRHLRRSGCGPHLHRESQTVQDRPRVHRHRQIRHRSPTERDPHPRTDSRLSHTVC